MPTLTEAQVIAQLAAQHTKYTTGATGLPVQDDQNARMALDNSQHTAVANTAFVNLNSTTVAKPHVNAKVYSGGNVVSPVRATYFEAQVTSALQGGTVFTYGGPYTSNYVPASPYVDSLALIEASKLTGEKLF